MNYTNSILKGAAHLKYKPSRIALWVTTAVASLGLLLGMAPAFATGNSMSTVYNNLPSLTPGNVPSVGFEATSASEFGSQVDLDGTARKNPQVTVLMSSWACKSGTWNNQNCITNPGSTFNHPVTLNVYNVNDDDSVGSLITTKTKTFTMPYRPTADDGTNCNGANAGKWWDGTACNNGKAFKIKFDLDGITLPDNVIFGIAYNTSNHGYAPVGPQACNATPQGCPYDSLNVGTNPAPSVGSSGPSNDDAYYNTSFAGFYCDSGAGGVNTFRLDSGCWTGFLPAFKVEASPGRGHSHHHHHYKWHWKGDKNHHNNYQGTHGFYNLRNR